MACRKYKGHHFGEADSLGNFFDDCGTIEGEFRAECGGELHLEFRNDALMTSKKVGIDSVGRPCFNVCFWHRWYMTFKRGHCGV